VTRLPALARATDARRSLGVLAVALVILGCTAPAAQESQAPSLTPAATSSANAAPSTPTPTPTSDPRLAVVAVDGLNLREGPGMDEPIQTVGPGIPSSGEPIRLSAGQRVWVIESRAFGGESWHHVVVESAFTPGWINGGPATDPWITPFDPATCPASISDELDRQALDLNEMRSLVCFGGEQVTLPSTGRHPIRQQSTFRVPGATHAGCSATSTSTRRETERASSRSTAPRTYPTSNVECGSPSSGTTTTHGPSTVPRHWAALQTMPAGSLHRFFSVELDSWPMPSVHR